jgi:nanoRNase/pAp phosphatase (c-di-AMP/oligoRNAs hydrolase)
MGLIMGMSNRERLKLFYKQFAAKDRVLVLMNADPDAIASAMAVKRLLWRRVSGVTISHINLVNRPDNKAMMELLDIHPVHIKDIEETRYTRFVLVDSQPDHHASFMKFKFDAVIDHHPETTFDADYADIRPHYGATATMLTEYLKTANIRPSVKLATGLFYAIKTDTDAFKRKVTIEDVRAFQFNFRYANLHLEHKIEQAELQPEFLKYFQKALAVKSFRRGRLFAHLDSVTHPDVLVLIADFFMRVNNVNWSIVSGVCKNMLIVILRNDGLNKNAGKVASSSFGSLGSAGGHKSIARAEIPVKKIKALLKGNASGTLDRWVIRQVEESAGKK